MFTGYIYLIHNLASNKVYVGQTARPIWHRWSEHKHHTRNSHLKNSINKYGIINFDYTVLDIIISTSEEELKKTLHIYENAWIQFFKSCSISLYNVRDAAESNKGCKRSEELKRQVAKKVSLALTGRKFNDSHKQNMSLARIGKRQSEERKQKTAALAKERWANKENRTKYIEAIKKHHPKGCQLSFSKFSEDDIRNIRKLFETNELNMTYKKVALLYSTVPSVIFNIVKRKTYKEL